MSFQNLQSHVDRNFAKGSSNKYMLHIQVVEAQNLKSADTNGLSDPYVKIKIDGATEKKLKTSIHYNSVHPVFDSTFSFIIKDSRLKGNILIETLDFDQANSNDSLGFTVIPLRDLEVSGCASGWFSLFKNKDQTNRRPGRLYLRMVVDKDRSKLFDSDPETFKRIRAGLLTLVSDLESECTVELIQCLNDNGSKVYSTSTNDPAAHVDDGKPNFPSRHNRSEYSSTNSTTSTTLDLSTLPPAPPGHPTSTTIIAQTCEDFDLDTLSRTRSRSLAKGREHSRSRSRSHTATTPIALSPVFSGGSYHNESSKNSHELLKYQDTPLPIREVVPISTTVNDGDQNNNTNMVYLPRTPYVSHSKAFIQSPLSLHCFDPVLLTSHHEDTVGPVSNAPDEDNSLTNSSPFSYLSIGHKLTIAVASWNVGNAPPSDSIALRSLFSQDADIIVFGTQENYYPVRKPYKHHRDDWTRTLHDTLGKGYTHISHAVMGQIMIDAFIRVGCERFVDIIEIDKATEATGIAGVGMNKGGVMVAMNIMGTPIVFINAHLAAHTPNTQRRNEDVAEILTGLRFKAQSSSLGIHHLVPHVVFLGDLNYRLKYAGENKEPSEPEFNEMLKMIDDGEYAKLLTTDQLTEEMAANRVFTGFTDCTPNFRPTFKVERMKADPTYTNQRTPSYCDRILWYSQPNSRNLHLVDFKSAPVITSSDHKPVVATFNFLVPLNEAACLPTGGLTELELNITSIRADKLKANDDHTPERFFRIKHHYVASGKAIISKNIREHQPSWGLGDVAPMKINLLTRKRLSTLCLPVALYNTRVIYNSNTTKLQNIMSQNTPICSGLLSLTEAGVDLVFNTPGHLFQRGASEEDHVYVSPSVPCTVNLTTTGNLPHGELTMEVAFKYKKGQKVTYADVLNIPQYGA